MAMVSPFKSENPTENELKGLDLDLQRGLGSDPRVCIKCRYLITLVKPAKPKRKYTRKTTTLDV